MHFVAAQWSPLKPMPFSCPSFDAHHIEVAATGRAWEEHSKYNFSIFKIRRRFSNGRLFREEGGRELFFPHAPLPPAPMPGWPDVVAAVLSNLLLCTVCLGSAVATFQISRGAAAGFLLQALLPLLEMAALVLTLPLGLSLDPPKSPLLPEEGAWVPTVVGLPLLAFGFHWLNGDCSTANTLLGGALLLAGGWNYFTEEGQAMIGHSVTAVTSITILIISVFTGNAYGVAGGLLVGTAGLLEGTKLQQLLALQKKDALRCLMAAANLALRRALQTQRQELDRGRGGVFASASD